MPRGVGRSKLEQLLVERVERWRENYLEICGAIQPGHTYIGILDSCRANHRLQIAREDIEDTRQSQWSPSRLLWDLDRE
jgi:hypothetical protein